MSRMIFLNSAGVRLFLPVICFFFFAHPLWALDLKNAFEIGKQNDPIYLGAMASANAVDESLPQAKALMLPNLALSSSANQVNLDKSEGAATSPALEYNSTNTTITLRQGLYRKNQWVQYEQAKKQQMSAQAERGKSESELLSRVTSFYFEAAYAQETLKYVQALQDAMLAQMKAAQRNFELGQGTRTDVDEARVRLDQANVQALQLRQQARYSQQQLALTLNQPINTLVPVDPSLLLARVPSKNLQSYIDLAHQNNPEAESGRAKLEIAKLEVAKAQSAHFPTLDLITQRSYSKSENVLTPMASYNTAQTGVQLNVPLFSGGYVNSTIRQSTYALERETQILEQTLRNLSLQVRKEYQNISEGMARIQAMEQSERSSAQLVLSTQKGVMAGTRTVTDVLNAFQRLAESRRDLAQARYQYLLAHQKLLLLSGESTTDVVLQINKMLSGSINLSSALP